MRQRHVHHFIVEAEDGSVTVVAFKGRDAWALCQLIAAGEAGCTPIDHPGPRWSGYIHNLRRAGVVVETRTEAHGGMFAGHHARYILRSRVRLAGHGDAEAA